MGNSPAINVLAARAIHCGSRAAQKGARFVCSRSMEGSDLANRSDGHAIHPHRHPDRQILMLVPAQRDQADVVATDNLKATTIGQDGMRLGIAVPYWLPHVDGGL